MARVKTKRVYEAPAASDGCRILVDRIWPRGISKAQAQLTEWLREIAPSDQLRRWFAHDPNRFAEFRERYIQELRHAGPDQRKALERLQRLAATETVTLLYAAKDEQHNQAVVLQEWLESNRNGWPDPVNRPED
ncbi:DUF488 domain-containing protein [Brevibacillus humidisoli]|uniref:DUF488 domain-containing protein n=1 Tax=Brevibacillus humidisoli TaxID=2895522 RepID=UPI001E59C525|nr:DUF488 domain-containing protein [Brevibacillus humidisoli]UFJ39829.1 DUF488 domain-containing protein [Brevibacillus humidisoli]